MYPDVVTLRKNSDVEVPLTAQQAEVLDKLLNPAGSLFRVGGRLANLEDAVFSGTSSVEGKSGNTIIVTKTSAGQYVDLQAAVNAAVAGDVILVGAGSWGPVDLSFKPGVSLMGLQPPLADEVVLSRLKFAPTSGTAGTNTAYIANLRLSSNSDVTAIELGGGGAPVRVTMSGVRAYRNFAGASSNPLVLCGGADTTTSIYMQDCLFGTEGSQYTSVLIRNGARYLDLNNCSFQQGLHCLDILSAAVPVTVAASLCRFETASAGAPCIKVASGASVGTTVSLAIGNSLVRNLGANSSGIQLGGAFSACAAANTVFDVSDGTGNVVSGTGLLAHNNISVQPAILGARETSISGTVAKHAFQVLS